MEQIRQKPAVGIVLGDPAGIGPEIVLKMMVRPSTYLFARPILIGNYELLRRTARMMDSDLFIIKCTPDMVFGPHNEAYLKGIPVVDIEGDLSQVKIGQVSAESGRIAYESLVCAYHLLEKGVLSGLIMGPLNKEALSQSDCGFHSEYEIFAHLAGVSEVQSVVKGGSLFRSSVVGHVPFRRIVEMLTKQRVIDTCLGLYRVLQTVIDEEPNICVAALNPHGSEDGKVGYEEANVIIPAIEELRKNGIPVHGPFPSDTIYLRAMNTGYNGIVYLYHDQGNIAMKAKMFDTTALIYTNVPYPILSTGHGSALDIAPLCIANPTNLCYVMSTLTNMLIRIEEQHAR